MSYNLDQLKQFLDLPEPYRSATCPYCNGTKDPAVKYPKKDPWTWWKDLGAPKFAVAPMVDQSELPFRMFCRKYSGGKLPPGVGPASIPMAQQQPQAPQAAAKNDDDGDAAAFSVSAASDSSTSQPILAYTPMFHSHNFATQPEYRKREFSTCPADRPLFVQFCGHDAETVLAAARCVEDSGADAVDLNLGCPQGIAKKGNYGSFLMEKWDVIHNILHCLSVELKIPVTAKMRVFDDVALTLRYARMLRDSGIHLLAVHGRTREMKGQQTGLADLAKIAAVKKEITNIPVLSNGNILQFSDIAANLALTKCDGVLSAEALLWDPRLFADAPNYLLTGRGFTANKAQRLCGVQNAKEYMSLVLGPYPCPAAWAKSHLFKMLHHSLEVHPTIRDRLGRITNDLGEKGVLQEMAKLVADLEVAERECDIDVYVKNHPRQNSDAVNGNEGDAASAAARQASAVGCEDGCEQQQQQQQQLSQLQLQQQGHGKAPPPGCRRPHAEANYEDQAEAVGDFFA